MKNSAFRSLGYLGRGEASEGNTWRDGSAGHFHDRRSGWREDRSGSRSTEGIPGDGHSFAGYFFADELVNNAEKTKEDL